jgi:hypothetical protein
MNPSMGGSGRNIPVAHGPDSNYPHQLQPTAVHICLKPLLYGLPAKPRGCSVLIQERYVQDERYIAIEHRDVRRDCVSFARDQYVHEPIHGGFGSQHP